MSLATALLNDATLLTLDKKLERISGRVQQRADPAASTIDQARRR
jgi:hypothetical protein